MRRLAIVDQIVSAAGVERFLHGLVGGLLEHPDIAEWEITILVNKFNSGGYPVRWPEHLTTANLHVKYLCDNAWNRFLNRLERPQRLLGIPGSGRLQRSIPQLLRGFGTSWSRSISGDARLWLERYCGQNHFDVVYFGFPYLMQCPRIRMPMVATPHDFNYKRFDTLTARARAQIDREMPEWLRRCRRVVVSSEFIASEVRRYYPEFADKVRVVRLGIPHDPRIPTDFEMQAFRQRAGLPQRFLLSPGWIVPHKNQKVLFEALGHLRRKGIDIPVVCVGPNSHELQPEERGKASGYVQETLRIADDQGLQYGRDYWGLGYVSDFDLECLYRVSTALVSPTLYEAGSFPAREAMRAGCPVLVSEIPALVEEAGLVEGNAWLFNPSYPQCLAEVIEELIAYPAKAQERAQRAAQIVTSVFSWEKTAAGYLSIFQELVR